MKRKKKCPSCGQLNIPGAFQCVNCKTNLEKVEITQCSSDESERVIKKNHFNKESDALTANVNKSVSNNLNRSINNSDSTKEGAPLLTPIFYTLAWFSLLGSLVLCWQLWPGDPSNGKEWETLAYIPSFTWLTVGVVQFALFTAIGQVLLYLKQIVINTEKNKK